MTGKVRNLSVARGGLPVLAGVSFDLEPGHALILRGPNGSGKTTLLRTLAGLQPALSGDMTLDPEDIAYAGHLDGIKSMLSVSENLHFWASVFGTNSIDAALDAFDLHSLKNRLAASLSAGQKRRLGLARLCVAGRRIWTLDEPTVSLDTNAVQMFANAVQTHLNGGGSAIIATHIDLGLPNAQTLDVTPFRATELAVGAADEAFL